jgi:sirohydrochlorin ferrochelatase
MSGTSRRSVDTTTSTAVLLLSHGSRDPRAAYVVGELVLALAAGTGMTVREAHLGFTAPHPSVALRQLAADGFTVVRVVPLLFTPGYHLTHDVPEAVSASGVTDQMDVSVAPALLSGGPGQRELLLTALDGRLRQAGHEGQADALVLASAGSSSPQARQCIEDLARDLGRRHGIPVEPAFASGGVRTPTRALEVLSDLGVERPAVASLFVAPGRLTDSVVAACPGLPVADPLGVSAAFVELLVAQTRALSTTK